jgi:hypothetical protein
MNVEYRNTYTQLSQPACDPSQPSQRAASQPAS